MYSPSYDSYKQKKTISFFLGDFKLYEGYNNTSLLKLQALKEEEVIEPRLKFSYVFLIGNSNLIGNVHRTLEGRNKIQLLGQRLTISLSFFVQLQNCFTSHELFEDESSWAEVFEDVKNKEIRNDLSNKGKKDSFLLLCKSEAEKVEVTLPESLEEMMNWLSKKNDLIRELEREVKDEDEIKKKIEVIRGFKNQGNEVDEWIHKVFFSDSTKLRIEDKTPSEILNDLEAELARIENDKCAKEESSSKGFDNNGRVVSTDDNPSQNSFASLSENKKNNQRFSKNRNLIIAAVITIFVVLLISIFLSSRKKKSISKTSPNKLQPEQPIDKKDIDYDDSFVY